jgi:hypothetical protein
MKLAVVCHRKDAPSAAVQVATAFLSMVADRFAITGLQN